MTCLQEVTETLCACRVADMTGDGRPDIVGKPYMPERHIDLWLNET